MDGSFEYLNLTHELFTLLFVVLLHPMLSYLLNILEIDAILLLGLLNHVCLSLPCSCLFGFDLLLPRVQLDKLLLLALEFLSGVSGLVPEVSEL